MAERQPRTKGPDAFRTIGEAAAEVGVAAHVLRFWESKFPQVQPLKRGGNRRYYRPGDIETLHRIKRLVHDEGYTIKGAAKALRTGKADAEAVPAEIEAETPMPNPDEPLLPLNLPATAGLTSEQRAGLLGVRDVLAGIAEECANVAAGKPATTATD